MTVTTDPDASPSDRVHDVARILEAITLAVREAVREHKRLGNPVAEWRDGQVVWLQPDEIMLDDED